MSLGFLDFREHLAIAPQGMFVEYAAAYPTDAHTDHAEQDQRPDRPRENKLNRIFGE